MEKVVSRLTEVTVPPGGSRPAGVREKEKGYTVT